MLVQSSGLIQISQVYVCVCVCVRFSAILSHAPICFCHHGQDIKYKIPCCARKPGMTMKEGYVLSWMVLEMVLKMISPAILEEIFLW